MAVPVTLARTGLPVAVTPMRIWPFAGAVDSPVPPLTRDSGVVLSVMELNVGVLAVPTFCGSERVMVPAPGVTMTWFAVPVSDASTNTPPLPTSNWPAAGVDASPEPPLANDKGVLSVIVEKVGVLVGAKDWNSANVTLPAPNVTETRFAVPVIALRTKLPPLPISICPFEGVNASPVPPLVMANGVPVSVSMLKLGAQSAQMGCVAANCTSPEANGVTTTSFGVPIIDRLRLLMGPVAPPPVEFDRKTWGPFDRVSVRPLASIDISQRNAPPHVDADATSLSVNVVAPVKSPPVSVVFSKSGVHTPFTMRPSVQSVDAVR